jgi:ribonuclease BN (tRNA processing enzyme)
MVKAVGVSLLASALAPCGWSAEPDARLVLLGTAGGPTPKKTRAAPSQALQVGDRVYLVDCGNGVGRQMALAGLPIPALRHVLVTHHHSDHVADLTTLPLLAWAAGLSERLTLHGPKPIRSSVRAARVDHPPIEEAYAYRFDLPGWSDVISGDTAPSERLVRLAKGADVLVHEVLLRSPAETSEWLGLLLDHPLVRHIVRSHTSYEDVGIVPRSIVAASRHSSARFPSPTGTAKREIASVTQ